MRRVSIVVLVLLMATFALVGCKRGAPVSNPQGSVTTVNNLTQKEVRQAIITACPKTRWVPKDIAPGVIEATVQVRSHTAVVTITYDAKKYDIKYKDSVNLRTQDGNIHPNYNKWVSTLRFNIDRELANISATK